MNKSKGFTIIELIVVIAIIAVLAAIVLVNVTSYINKGKDAAIKGNMSTIATAAAVFYSRATNDTPAGGGGTYLSVTSDPAVSAAITAITAANAAPTTGITATTGLAYCVEAPLKDTTTGQTIWCVDSTGYVGYIAATHCANATPSCK